MKGFVNRKNYFEGWFQKIYLKEQRAAVLIIFGYATQNTREQFGFIQILLPRQRPLIYYFPKHEVTIDLINQKVQMKDNLFSTREIRIDSELLKMNLRLSVSTHDQSLKNTMGYTYYLPGLPCYHAVVNASHLVSGSIQFNKVSFQLNDERAYLEKNWGNSFPKDYVWLHAIDPADTGVSLLFSCAYIFWMGRIHFKHVGYICLNGLEIDFRELKNVKIECRKSLSTTFCISLLSDTVTLRIDVISLGKITLKGPDQGRLSRDILHHPDVKMLVSIIIDTYIDNCQLVGNFEVVGSDFINEV